MRTMRPKILTAIALTVTLGAGCMQRSELPRRARHAHVTVRAHLQNGVPRIDESLHDAELLRPGDRISFLCDCDPGLEFSVSRPRLELDLDALDHLFVPPPGQNREARLAWLRSELAKAKTRLGSSDPMDDPTRDFLRSFVADFSDVVPDAAGEHLLPHWRDPGFRPGGERIGPFLVGPLHRNSVWKFTWKVRVQGSTGNIVQWDPHLFGNRN